MLKVLSGNKAAVYGAKLARVEVAAVYPITPQSQISEDITKVVAAGELDCDIIEVEGEHSAMSAIIGASTVGARVFTATSSWGLAYMNEPLMVCAGMRIPAVMVDVTRETPAQRGVSTSRQDVMTVRDCGWLELDPASPQEVLDSVLMAYQRRAPDFYSGADRWSQELLHLWTLSILRVNLGEAQALLAMNSREQGVDSPGPASQRERLYAAVALARSRRTVVLLSGPEDIVTDGASTWVLWGGSDQMSRITGTGCMLSVLCGAFAAVAGAREAALLASAFWKVCAAQAEERTQGRGPGSFHTALLDAAGTLTPADLAAGTQIQEISHRSEPQ